MEINVGALEKEWEEEDEEREDIDKKRKVKRKATMYEMKRLERKLTVDKLGDHKKQRSVRRLGSTVRDTRRSPARMGKAARAKGLLFNKDL